MTAKNGRSERLVSFLKDRQLLAEEGLSSSPGAILRIVPLSDVLGFSVTANYQFDDANLTPIGVRFFPPSPSRALGKIMHEMKVKPHEPDTVFVVWFVFDPIWDGQSLPKLARMRVGQLSKLKSFDWALYDDYGPELESFSDPKNPKTPREFSIDEGLELTSLGYGPLSGKAGPHSLKGLMSKLKAIHLAGESLYMLLIARPTRSLASICYRRASRQRSSNSDQMVSTPLEDTESLNFAGLSLPRELTITASIFWIVAWVCASSSEKYEGIADLLNTAVGAPLSLFAVAFVVKYFFVGLASLLDFFASWVESKSTAFSQRLLI